MFVKTLFMMFLVSTGVAAEPATPSPVDDILFDDMPVVLTATRLQQPQNEAPASVTIIDKDMIHLSGARNIPEILQLVPGIQVGYEHGHQASISYHGAFDERAHRLQVLIDGRSIYQPADARILWMDIPLAVSDIQRVEVIRGPDAALYGANSFNAVINIITSKPAEESGGRISVRHGDKQIRDSLIRYSGKINEKTDWRLSVGSRADDGFDADRTGNKRYDGYDAGFMQGQIDVVADRYNHMDLQWGYSSNNKEIQGLDSYESGKFHLINDRNSYVLAHWYQDLSSNHEWRWQLYWNQNNAVEDWTTCPFRYFLSDELRQLFDADPMYTREQFLPAVSSNHIPPPPENASIDLYNGALQRAAVDGNAMACGQANQNVKETRFDAEWQDTWHVSDALRIVSGLSLRRDMAYSETYFQGSERSVISRFFSNAEYRFTPSFIANIGAMWEHDTREGNNVSPRFALNWIAGPSSSFRAIYSRAVRTPGMFEQSGGFHYTLTNLSEAVNGNSNSARFFQSSESSGGLDAEEIRSTELGWFGSLFSTQITLDVKLFHDRYLNLVDGNTSLAQFALSNMGSATINGEEMELNWRPLASIRLHAGASQLNLIDSSSSDSYIEHSTPKRTYNFLAGLQLPLQMELALTYYEMNEIYGTRYELAGMRLNKEWPIDHKTRFEAAIDIRRRLDNHWFFEKDNVEVDNTWLWLTASLWF